MLAYVKTRLSRRWLAVLLPWLALLPLGAAGRALQAAPAAAFTVNVTVDASDAAVGDGLCETVAGNGVCTLRAAIQEASADPDPDTIYLPAGTYHLSRTGNDDSGLNGDLDVTGTLTLVGAGPASTTIDATAMLNRVFDVHTGAVTIEGVTIQGGLSENAAGVLNRSGARLTLTNTVIARNRSEGYSAQGGGIYNIGYLTLTHSLVVSNFITSTAVPQGGGIFQSSSPDSALIVAHSTISGNVAENGEGGGLFIAWRPVTITHSTISHNQARRGGGLYAASDGVWIVNSTLSANRAGQDGGGLVNTISSGSVHFYNATVAGNWANDGNMGAYGGGVAGQAGTVSFVNSLLASNFRTDWAGPFVVASDCAGGIVSAGANYVSTTDGCTINGTAPLTGGVTLLGPLADNGGPAPTHVLLPGSPAIDAGAEAGCTDPFGQVLAHDQRGQPRHAFGGQAARCDLGAYERQVLVLLPFVRR